MLKLRNKRSLIPIIVLVFLFCFWQNNGLVITTLVYENDIIPTALTDLQIVQISDLHNKSFGKNQRRLLEPIAAIKPAMIVVTGDLIDSTKTDFDTAMLFIRQALDIAPVYYVSGNHEARSGRYSELKQLLTAAGVTVLDNDSAQFMHQGQYLNIIGLSDPAFSGIVYGETNIKEDELLQTISTKIDGNVLNILLSHRPELMELYTNSGVDLVFSGHAHGGQIRLPLIGGIVAPNQGFFPKLTSGSYEMKDTTMVVSRGLGNSIFPLRIFNRPEIVVVKLKNK